MDWKFIIPVTLLICQSVDSSLPCKFIETINITGGYKDRNQNFVYKSDIYPFGTYQEFNYVEDYAHVKTSVDPHIRGCICNLKPCVRLCCKGYDERIPNCFESGTFTVKNENGTDDMIDLNDDNYGILVGRPCFGLYVLDSENDPDDYWNFLENGSIYLQTTKQTHGTDEYCLGRMNESQAMAYLCFQSDDKADDHRFTVYPIGMFISIPFLIITFVVYAYIKELRNVHGKCLMCYTLSLTILYAFLITAQMKSTFFSQNICGFIGYSIYFGTFLSFFWMNVMCYDIWKIASKGILKRSPQEQRKTFTIYSIYAIGCPLLMIFSVILIDYFEIFDQKHLPKIGYSKCWIQSEFRAEAIYVYIPISVIILTNIILFVDTAKRIWNVHSSQPMEENNRKRNRILRKRFYTYLRLFILMGIMWCMESISWLFKGGSISWLFYITDMFNCLQGFLIFLICVCDPRTRRLIAKRCFSSRVPEEESETHADDLDESDENLKLSVGKR